MKKLIQVFIRQLNLFIYAVFMVSALSACSKSGTVSPRGDSNSSLTGSHTVQDESTVKALKCPVPFALEVPGATPLTVRDHFPKGKFELKELKVHETVESTGNSFSASSKASKGFVVEIECDGVQDMALDERMEGSFRASMSLDLNHRVMDAKQREIKIAFEKGRLVESLSHIIQNTDDVSNDDQLDSIPLDRIVVGIDSYVTIRIYSSTEHLLDFRMKWEGPADSSGNRVIQYSRAIYEKVENNQ